MKLHDQHSKNANIRSSVEVVGVVTLRLFTTFKSFLCFIQWLTSSSRRSTLWILFGQHGQQCTYNWAHFRDQTVSDGIEQGFGHFGIWSLEWTWTRWGFERNCLQEISLNNLTDNHLKPFPQFLMSQTDAERGEKYANKILLIMFSNFYSTLSL